MYISVNIQKMFESLQMLECSSHVTNLSTEMAISSSEMENILEAETSHFIGSVLLLWDNEDLSNRPADQSTW